MSAGTEISSTQISNTLPMVVQLRPVIELSDDQLFEFAAINRDLRIERTRHGEIAILPPAGGESSARNAELTMQLRLWAKRDCTGTAFDSSAGFVLPSGAMLSPDAARVSHARLNALIPKERKRFPLLCPEFIIELRSESDRLSVLQAKMQAWIENGVRLGLLLDPLEKRVHVYRSDSPVEILEDPATVACSPLLPGFVLDIREIW